MIVRVLHPDITIKRCRLFLDGLQFALQNGLGNETIIEPGGAANFILARDKVMKGGSVVVKDGNAKICDIPLEDIITTYDF